MNWNELVARYSAVEDTVGGYLPGSVNRDTITVTEAVDTAGFIAAVKVAAANTQSGVVALDGEGELGYTPAVKFDDGSAAAGFAEGVGMFVIIDLSGSVPALVVYHKPAA